MEWISYEQSTSTSDGCTDNMEALMPTTMVVMCAYKLQLVHYASNILILFKYLMKWAAVHVAQCNGIVGIRG